MLLCEKTTGAIRKTTSDTAHYTSVLEGQRTKVENDRDQEVGIVVGRSPWAWACCRWIRDLGIYVGGSEVRQRLGKEESCVESEMRDCGEEMGFEQERDGFVRGERE